MYNRTWQCQGPLIPQRQQFYGQVYSNGKLRPQDIHTITVVSPPPAKSYSKNVCTLVGLLNIFCCFLMLIISTLLVTVIILLPDPRKQDERYAFCIAVLGMILFSFAVTFSQLFRNIDEGKGRIMAEVI